MNSLSFVIPCLNEEKTLPIVLEKINRVRESSLSGYKTEIVVSDNGSTDNSIEIAKKFGARVVHCPTKGYGAALKNGINNAEEENVVFADADDTYDFFETPKLIFELERGYDLVIGDRINGNIHKGAMPWLHQYLGTPILTFIINQLYANTTNRVNDCNSGFRCFKKKSFQSWKVKSDGMEFASEMLIKAVTSNAKISHVPISLSPDHKDRQPHLRTWTDGMRHLLQIMAPASRFFYRSGAALFFISWMIIIIALGWGPIQVGIFGIFGIHTMMFATLGTVFGITIMGIGLFLGVSRQTQVGFYNYLIYLEENKVFWLSFSIIFLAGSLFLRIFIQWGIFDFKDLAMEYETLVLITFSVNICQFVFIMLTAHLIKRI